MAEKVRREGYGFYCASDFDVYLWCSRKARWLISLSSIEEVAHYAIQANLHIEAFTMLEHTWQSVVGCRAVLL